MPLPISAAGKKPKTEPHALVAVSVFSAEGFALPGVEIRIKRKEERKSRWRSTSDRRGEAALRLPPGRATYEVSTATHDYENQTQAVEIYGEERADVVFRLSPKKN